MDPYQSVIATIALTMGTAWASGINLYATIGMLGILGATGNIVLPETLVVLQDPLVIFAAAVMYCVEFLQIKPLGLIQDGMSYTLSSEFLRASFSLPPPLAM